MNALARLLCLAAAVPLLTACSRPCDAPLTYRLGDVDSGFRISRDELLTALRRAESVWEEGARRDLFHYEADGGIAVNLVYDDRQETAQENARRKLAIDSTGDSADVLRRKVDAGKKELERAKTHYRDAQATFDSRLASHNAAVEQWNSRGGAPPAARDMLAREAAALRSLGAALDKQRGELNALVDHINGLSDRHNELATEINSAIDEVNATAGEEFKQGMFLHDAEGARIDVFEYVDHDDLVQVLAHELGHALGLPHNDNPASIMFRKNVTDAFHMTAEDLAALAARCGP